MAEPPTNTAVAKRPEQRTLSQIIAMDSVKSFASHALGNTMDVEHFLTQLAISFQKPELAECSVDSQIKAVNACAALGLLPSLRQVAIIPRAKVATVMPEYRGYMALMMRQPEVLDVTTRLVHKTDQYEVENRGSDGAFMKSHTYDPLASDRTIKSLDDLKGGYVVVKLRDGSEKHHFVHVDVIRKAMGCAQTKNIWNQWPEEQALKTCLRNAFNRNIVHLDFAVATGLKALDELDDDVQGNQPIVVDSRSKTERLTERLAVATSTVIQDAVPAVPTAAKLSADVLFWTKQVDDAQDESALMSLHAEWDEAREGRPQADIEAIEAAFAAKMESL